MVGRFSRAVGGFALITVSLGIVAVLSLFMLGSYLLTWPILRMSPRDRRIKVIIDLAQASFAALSALNITLPDQGDDGMEESD